MPATVGYSGKPLIQKLGLKEAQILKPVGAPGGYADWIAPLPAGAVVDADAAMADLVHLFVSDRAGLERGAAPALAAVRPGGMLPTGWVDVKVCAVSNDWSGLKFLRRRA